MPTSKQDRDFAEEMKSSVDEVKMADSALDSAITWIGSHLDPEDVFTIKELETWAENNGYTKE